MNDLVVVELKAIDRVAPIHTAQVLTYLKLTGYPIGLLINCNVPLLRHQTRAEPAARVEVSRQVMMPVIS